MQSARLEKDQAAMRERHTPRVFTQTAAPSTEPAHTTRFLSIAQIAEELNISHDSALRLFRDHPEAVCMSPDMANRKRLSLRIPRTVVEEFINSRKRANCRSFPERKKKHGGSMKYKRTATNREVPWINFTLARNSTDCIAFIDSVFALKDRCAGLTSIATKRAVITETRHDCHDGIFFDHDNGGEKIRNVLFHFISAECFDCYERLVSEAALSTEACCYTNGLHAFVVNYCDVCGDFQIDYEPESLTVSSNGWCQFVETWDDAKRAAARQSTEHIPASDLVARFRERLGLELQLDRLHEFDSFRYSNGLHLLPGKKTGKTA